MQHSKREVWQQIQKHMPEYADMTRRMGETFGIRRVMVKTPEGKFDTGRLK